MPTIDQLVSLVSAVQSAARYVDDVHDDDYDAGHAEVTEEIQDKAVADERAARDALIAFLRGNSRYPRPTRGGASEPDGPIALIMPDGSIVAFGIDWTDGLIVVGPESVHRIFKTGGSHGA